MGKEREDLLSKVRDPLITPLGLLAEQVFGPNKDFTPGVHDTVLLERCKCLTSVDVAIARMKMKQFEKK